MTNKQIINRLNKNRNAQFLLFEIQNLAHHFDHPDGTDNFNIRSAYDYRHSLADTIENLYGSLCGLLKLPEHIADCGENYEMLLLFDLTTLSNAYITKKSPK